MDMELVESYCLRVQYKGGGIFHERLNRGEKPIANKYCEGKLARTLEKELEEPEVVLVEAIDCRTSWQVLWCMVSVMAVCVAQCLLVAVMDRLWWKGLMADSHCVSQRGGW